MKDRFKFRGKRLDNNQWYYGSYLYLHNATEYDYAGNRKETKKDVHFIIDENDINYAVDPETVGQCTSLKDKNGKLIFEGDIVKAYFTDDDILKYDLMIVEWCKNSCAFVFKDYKFKNFEDFITTCFESESYEVVGNIYQHKELLNE